MAQYPSSAATDANLYVAVNNLNTTLVGALTASGGNYSGTEIEVASTTGWPTTGFITIDLEAISYTGIATSPHRFTGITRGADGTTAASHSNGATVYHHEVAAHHNALKEEVKAIETDLIDSVKQAAYSNILINGGMEFWQRAVSFSSPALDTYTADRWKTYFDTGTPTFTISKETTEIDSVGLTSMKLAVTIVNSAANLFVHQYIENYADYRGKTITLSARVKASSANSICLRVASSSGNSFSSKNVGTGWETISVTHTVGTATTGISVGIGFYAGGSAAPIVSTNYFDSMMLTLGNQAVSFSARPMQHELALCQRYYEKSYNVDVIPGTNTLNGRDVIATIAQSTSQIYGSKDFFKVPKYTTPTISYWTSGGISGSLVIENGTGSVSSTGTATAYEISPISFGTYSTGVPGNPFTANIPYMMLYQWTAQAEI